MIKIGTGGSKLAQRQADSLIKILDQKELDYSITIYNDADIGSEIHNSREEEDRSSSVKEITEALLKGEIDIAVHPLNKLSPKKMEGLITAGISERKDPSDLLLIRKESYVETNSFKLKENALIGTSSKRRKALITYFRPDFRIIKIGGTIDSQIDELRKEKYDGIILAKANLDLLQTDVSDFEKLVLNPREFIPAPGQGVVAYQTRTEDMELRKDLARWTSRKLVRIINVERKIHQLVDGTIGAFCEMDAMGHFHVWACHADEDGENLKFVQYSSSTNHQLAESIVKKLKDDLDI